MEAPRLRLEVETKEKNQRKGPKKEPKERRTGLSLWPLTRTLHMELKVLPGAQRGTGQNACKCIHVDLL
jgi:hypothetical protein